MRDQAPKIEPWMKNVGTSWRQPTGDGWYGDTLLEAVAEAHEPQARRVQRLIDVLEKIPSCDCAEMERLAIKAIVDYRKGEE